MNAIDHHQEIARHARMNSDTYRRYLTWSRDPDQRRWAEEMAAAAEIEADASDAYAEVLRQRGQVPA